MDAQRAKLVKPSETDSQPMETPAIPAIAANIDYDQFAGLDLRVATILEAIKVPKADRLLQLTLDTGVDRRTVLSGIAEHFTPEEVVGRQVSAFGQFGAAHHPRGGIARHDFNGRKP